MNYWNSTIRIKPTRLKQGGKLKAGRRAKDWRKVWRFLKAEFEKRGRVRCEFGFIPHECFGRLDPCHSKKRRLMQGDDIYAIALGCQQAHKILDEAMSHAEMETAVLRAIEANGGLILPEGKRNSMSEQPKHIEACWAMPKCLVCGLKKKPYGRDAGVVAANDYCGEDCEGYHQEPLAGHFWPGEVDTELRCE